MSKRRIQRHRPHHLSHFLLGVGIILGPVTARADIVADSSAAANQQPTVLQAGNGVPLVNIRTPSAAGVSRNAYSEFDVDNQGAILNNGRTDSQTQLSGWVQANPWLATGSARVILNEVNSSDPSQLNGYVEVAGGNAQVIIANPAGISCDGCGFINANRATLSTGTPTLSGGDITGYQVQQGQITINGAGLDNSNGYTDLIGRAVEINAGIWTQQLNVAGGAGTVNAAVTQSAPANGNGSAPQVAIDVSQLGGMYANSIRLIGTEAGVGVRNAGQIGVGAGQVTITADGRIENTGTLSSGQITAQTDQTLANQGVITGTTTQLSANTLDNTGSGRIYGNQVAIEANTVNNIASGNSAPVIAAQQQLDIAATTINNQEHALIYSGGDMTLGGEQAATLNNNSATIEAKGNLNLAVQTINNTNEHLQLEDVLVSSESVHEYRGSGSDNRYTSSEVGFIRHDQSRDLRTPDGTYDVWYEYTYTRDTYETQIINSDPAKIIAGGNVALTTDLLNNDNSQILAGGDITGTTQNLVNTSAERVTVVDDNGTIKRYTRKEVDDAAGTKSHWEQRISTNGYRPADQVTAITDPIATSTENASNVGSNTTLPDSSLFTLNPDAPQGFLIETDPQFTQYQQWISSDYMLALLAVDPALTQMRLGDGFFEQQLIREQVAELTGRRFLEGYADDEAQYVALMEAGVTFAQAHELRPGIALTADQIAQLTSDIVWLVEEQRTLPDGSTANVLVPRLYVMVRADGINTDGALIAADNIRLEMGADLDNSGTIASQHITALTAENINNVNGTLQGQNVTLNANHNINNVGGSIRAQDSLTLNANNDINVTTTTRTQGDDKNNRTNIDRIAGLYVNSGSLLANAGHDINLSGAAIVNNVLTLDAERLGNTVLTAGNDFVLNSVQESEQQTILWNDGRTSVASNTITGTRINSSGNIQIQAGNNVRGGSSHIQSEQGNVAIAAVNDIDLSADKATYQERSGASNYRSEAQQTRHNLVSIDSAGTTTLSAGNNLTLTGAQLNAGATTKLQAQGETTIAAVVDSDYHYETRSNDRSYGRSDKSTDETLTSQVIGGTINSGGDLQINAHKNAAGEIITEQSGKVELVGAQLHSQGDVAIASDDDVTITGIQLNSLDYHQTQSSGLGGLSKTDEGQAATATHIQNASIASVGNTHIQSGRDLNLIATDVITNGDVNLTAIDELIVAAGQTLQSAQEWKNESRAFHDANLYEMQERSAGQTVGSAQASTITAGGSVNAQAGTGRIIGSDIHGNQGVNLVADAGDFSVEAVQTTYSQYVHEKEVTVTLGDGSTKVLINPLLAVQTKDGRATVELADAKFSESDSTSTGTQMRGSNISSNGDVNISASAGSVNVIGSNLASDVDGNGTGDVNLSAAQQVNITEATDTYSSESKTVTGEGKASVVVQHQAVEVVKAVERLNDAKQQLEQAKRDYSDYQRNLDQLENQLGQLEQDYADKKPGGNYDDLVELRGLVDDVRDDKEWYLAGMALASLNLVTATNALANQVVALKNSGETYGFNAGLQLDLDASKTRTEAQATTAVASTVTGQNIRINTGTAGATAGTTTNIQGSQLLASDNISINTGDLNITASKNTGNQSSETEHGHVTAQVTVWGASGGASVNANFDRSKNSARDTTYNNSVVLADSIDITTSGDATLRGATVRAQSALNTDIGGDLTVESVQNRASSRNTSAGVSGGVSLGGDGIANEGNDFTRHIQTTDDIGAQSGFNVGASSGNGMSSDRTTVLTSLTSGGTANINVQNHTQITGALIGTTDDNGNDLKQMIFSTDTLTFTDLRDSHVSSQTNASLSINFNLEPAKTESDETAANPAPSPAAQAVSPLITATNGNGQELKPGTTNIIYNNSQQNSADKQLATLGHGTISVGGTVLEQNGELTEAGKAEDSPLAGLNRDTSTTSQALWNSDYSQDLDVTVDNRLLNTEHWDEFAQDYVDAADAAEQMYDNAADKVQKLTRELAAMGNDLPEHLRQRLGERGEQLVDTLILAGLSDESIDWVLANEDFVNAFANLGTAIDSCTSVDTCIPQKASPQSKVSSHRDSDGLLVVEITSGVQFNPLQIGVTSLGQLNLELKQLAIIDPDAARAVELALQTVTGGPLKTVLSFTLERVTEWTLNKTPAQEVAQDAGRILQEVMYYSGALVQGASKEAFADNVASEESHANASDRGAASATYTLEGLELADRMLLVGVGSIIAKAVGNGGGGSHSGQGHTEQRGVGDGPENNLVRIDTSKSAKGTAEYDILNNAEARQANTKYELDNGKSFTTNSYGQVEELSFTPVNSKVPRDSRQTQAGKQGRDTDVGGHAQACSQGGTCDGYNLFPQDANFNNSAYKVFYENKIKKALNDPNQTVGQTTIKFERIDPSSPRPDTMSVTYTINGKTKTVRFENEAASPP